MCVVVDLNDQWCVMSLALRTLVVRVDIDHKDTGGVCCRWS